MLSRRELLELIALAAAGCATQRPTTDGIWVNDVHSELNKTLVTSVRTPHSIDELAAIVRDSRRKPVCISGSRHAMGGQQFASNAALVDMRTMNRVLSFDRERGIVEIEAGIEWPELMNWTSANAPKWGIAQKQTGADRLTLGGALAANAHGRGLRMQPIAGDVESFTLVDASGDGIECSRTKNAELFALAIGGYGLFGPIATVKLRLIPRRKVERVVEIREIEEIAKAFQERIDAGFLYGDFQFSIDEASDTFLRRGVFSCYRPVSDDTPIPETQAELQPEDWLRLLYLAHADKKQAYERYTGYYHSTSGQVYWSDSHQLSYYPSGYHEQLDLQMKRPRGSEMIGELYVKRDRLADFMLAARDELRKRATSVVYGTVRLIERDDVTVLPWARDSYACVIFNLHTEHDAASLERTAGAYRGLIDLAMANGGSYYLTYHRWARRDQVEACYPRMAEFLAAKRRYDPHERFQSDWYRHQRALMST